jgi:SAM-dependent methyltransferase
MRTKFSHFLSTKYREVVTENTERFPPLSPELPLPSGVSEERLFDFLMSVRVENGPEIELQNYCKYSFRRFVYTYGLCRTQHGRGLELGANPYFTTILIRQFASFNVVLANYFGSHFGTSGLQNLRVKDFESGQSKEISLHFDHFNIELERFPYRDTEFDIVLFCEIIEHLTQDPVHALKEIKRILKPGGILILTTPNVSRLENVAKMIAGANIYDPYSGHGPYGRHNREYNKHELYLLLKYLGFTITEMFTADVHPNQSREYTDVASLANLLRFRRNDLGQYIFLKAINNNEAKTKMPDFLFRSYGPELLETV